MNNNMMPGNMVTHPMFPQWGKGVITAIFIDTVSGKSIAKVIWQGVNAPSAAALHTLGNLVPFVDCPESDSREQLTLNLR